MNNFCAIIENSISIGLVSSYNDGASARIASPANDANVNKYKKKRSKTIATKPQSWSSCFFLSFYHSKRYLKRYEKISLTALNSSIRCIWCWMNITLWIAFSNSNGYFLRAPKSLKESSSPDMTDGKPL